MRRRSPSAPRRTWLATLVIVLVAALAAAGVGLATGGRRGGVATARSTLRPRRTREPRPRERTPRRGALLAREDAFGNARIEALARLGLPVYCGGRHGRDVALTFDDGPGVYTHYAVAKLRQWHERATFFVVGRSIEAWPGWLRRELKLGAIGDHTMTHPYLPGLSPRQIAYQLERTRSMIERGTGQHVDLFRPPYGALNRTVLRVARRLGLLAVMWTQDSRDSLGADWLQIIHNVERALHPGAIILMHENRGQTIRALTTLLPVLHRRHLTSVSLPELMAVDPPSRAQLRRGSAGCGFAGAGRGTG